MSNFVYLHLHTHFSLGGGPAAPAEWCRRAAGLGYEAIGIADRSPMVGLPSGYKAAAEAGLALIYGMELDILLPVTAGRKPEYVVQTAILFARSTGGMLSLANVASEAFSGWPGSEKAIPWEIIAASAGNLVVVLLGGDEAGALAPIAATAAKKLSGWASAANAAFAGAIFIGLPHSGRPGDNMIAEQIAAAAAALDLPVVATSAARYLTPEDAPAYEALKLARKRAGWPRDDSASASTASVAPDRPGHDYLRSSEEAAALYARWPQAVENAARIAEICSLDAGTWPFLTESTCDNSFLQELAEKRLLDRLNLDVLPEEKNEQLNNELGMIRGQHSAWVALCALTDKARSAGPIPIGTPTGSASHSLLAFALGFSPIAPTDQLKTQNSKLKTPPHLAGVEVPAAKRDTLVSSVSHEYGPGRIAHAACSLAITPIAAAQAAGSVLGISGDDLNALAVTTLGKGWDAFSPDSEQNGNMEKVSSLALSLRHAPLIFSRDPDTFLAAPRQTHSAATLSAYGPLLSAGAAQWLPWSEEEVGVLGYPAFSLCPSQPLSSLDAALSLARRYPVPGFQAEEIDLSALPPLTEAATSIMQKGDLVGIPYLTAAAAKSGSNELTFDTAAQMVARSLRPTRPAAPEPKPATWDEITASTSGDLLFTDQMAALLESMGIRAEDSGPVIRGLSDAHATETEAARAMVITACELEAGAAQALWDALSVQAKLLLDRDAAAAWGRTALWLVALKAAHPAAFLGGVLSTTTSRAGIAGIASEARRLGIKIEPPNANRSDSYPTLQRDGETWAVLWGLNQLPGWHPPVTARFLAARPPAGFSSLREVAVTAADAGISIEQIDILIHSGACDALGSMGAHGRDRSAMLAAVPALLEWAQATRMARDQLDLFSAPVPEPQLEEDLQENDLRYPPRGTHSPRALYLRRLWEEANIGVAFTGAGELESLITALEKSSDLRSRLLNTAQVGEQQPGTSVFLVGILCSIRTIESTSPGESDPMAAAWLEDAEGSIELVAFPPNYKRHADLWTESNMVMVTARVSCHDDGQIYLVSEHMAPFQAGSGEEAMTLTIKAPRQPKSARPEASPPGSTPVRPAAQPVAAASGATQPMNRPTPQYASSSETATYSLIISIPPAADDHTVIDSMIALNNLLTSHPGPDSVTIRVQYSPETGKWTSARLPQGVRFSHALENNIRRLLSDDSLAVIKLIG